MAEENHLGIKAFFDNQNQNIEIRRFGVPEEVSTNFIYLKQKLQNVFCLGSREITVTWQDSDGDHIVISSDTELVEAINECIIKGGDEILRLYVSTSENGDKDDGDQKVVHEGIDCDGCEGPVIGFRYKCLSCLDFDLCSSCESKGLHKEHKMIRYSNPKDSNLFWCKEDGNSSKYGFYANLKNRKGHCRPHFKNFNSYPPPPFQGSRGPPSSPFNYESQHNCPPSPFGPFYHFKSKTNGSQSGKQQDCPFQGFAYSNTTMGNNLADINKFADDASKIASTCVGNVMKDIWSAWTGTMGDHYNVPSGTSSQDNPKKDKSSKGNVSQQESENIEPMEESSEISNPPASQTPSAPASQTPSAPASQAPSAPASQAPSAPASQTPSAPASQTPSAPVSQTPSASVLQTPSASVSKAPAASVSQAPAAPVSQAAAAPVSQNSSTSVSQVPSSSDSQTPSITMEESYACLEHSDVPQLMEDSAVTGQSKTKSSLSSENGGSVHGLATPGWIFVGEPEKLDTGKETNNNSTKNVENRGRPDACNSEGQTANLDPSIRRALEQMQEMGYSNEGGWLTRLLQMKSGNIDEVLELLMPTRH